MNCLAINDSMGTEIRCERIIVSGVVQGVGFRPFVYNAAKEFGITGKVTNTLEGVEIIIQGNDQDLVRFRERLAGNPPPLSKITGVYRENAALSDFRGFAIEKSRRTETTGTIVPPDTAVCDSCLAEMADPSDRRYGYPFINCTHCGPRYSLVRELPLDRRRTTMAVFSMCPDCLEEYEDPSNRRFHAQATCCPACGPGLYLVTGSGDDISLDDPVAVAAGLLRQGKIVAVKGVGGFHLAADAGNEETVARLRRLKERGDKPFAVMASSVDSVRRFADVDREEEFHLLSRERPVVILCRKKKPEYSVAESVAPGNPMIGAMLPYTPLHVLLLGRGLDVLVMTSANRKDEPIYHKNCDSLYGLKDLADAFLLNDRSIRVRCDDSVGRVTGGTFRLVRRSRGYSPLPLALSWDGPDILATGGNMKNTLCLAKGRSAFLSQHIGDLETVSGYGFFHETAVHMARLFGVEPAVVVKDMHPGYITSGYGNGFREAETVTVQHHHAHIASCMSENGFDGDVIGIAFDGTGYGGDGTVWGGEVLVASLDRFVRAAHLDPVPMPGGDLAVKEPWRMGVSYLFRTFGEEMTSLDIPLFRQGPGSDGKAVATLLKMMERKLNSPLTSSMGRLFDAVAAILGLVPVNTFDGQAAMALEMRALSANGETGCYPLEIPDRYDFPQAVDMRPLIRALVSDLLSGSSTNVIAARFHRTLIRLFSGICSRIAEKTGIQTVALSGGVFQNGFLLAGLLSALEERNFSVLTHRLVPCNDGGLSLGQAAVARAVIRTRTAHGS
jgi:hydrogenase maturation protein HypF